MTRHTDNSHSDTVIQVEDLSKLYRLGQVGTTTLGEDLMRWWYRLRGKGNPFAIVGERNDRETEGDTDYVWALKDISLEVKKGERLGIIGANGAGKSTLLKILSKVTGPTTGNIKVRGRLASLLEVGTGFHPEMTGRENIYMNGAILGMTRREIRAKLDDIVDFAGVARYVDTPAKRYSSGMKVRLGFAVAAHLDPDILVVDEVLAVGDAEFQKRAVGKMEEVSNEQGRTILFVSHNMQSIANLCSRAILMNEGGLTASGPASAVIQEYLASGTGDSEFGSPLDRRREDGSVPDLEVCRVTLVNSDGVETDRLLVDEPFSICIHCIVHNQRKNYAMGIAFFNSQGIKIASIASRPQGLPSIQGRQGEHIQLIAAVPNRFLPGSYSLGVAARSLACTVKTHEDDIGGFRFRVEAVSKTSNESYGIGVFRQPSDWKLIRATSFTRRGA